MDNNELLSQVATMMADQTAVLSKMITDSETRINIKIENEVAGRIDALFDGYKLTHEKQYELEREFEALKRRMERLEMLVSQTA